jgi:bla regulator protein BlaR1
MNTIEGLTIRWQPLTAPTILSHLWQSTMVGIVILILLLAVRRASARTRWAIGCIGLVKFILPLVWFNPTISRLGPASIDGWSFVSNSLSLPVRGIYFGEVSRMFKPSRVVEAMTADNTPLIGMCAGVWAAGAFLFVGAWYVRGFVFRRRILATSGPVSPSLKTRIERASIRVGLAEPPCCLFTDLNSGPGVVGIFSPFMVLPRTLEVSLSGREIDSIILHELIHLKRRDGLVAGLQAVLVRLFWFNPVVWLLNRSLRLEMEKSCDEAVLDITADAKAYAGGILKIVRQSLGPQAPGFAGATGVSIVARMKNILARSTAPRRRRPMTAAIGAAVLLVVFSGFSGAIRADAAASTPSGRALVVSNLALWNRIPDFETELGHLGYASATIGSADMATTDFSQYSLIVIPGTQLQTEFYADYAKAAARFDQYVKNGGTLLLEVKGAEGQGILRQRFGAIPVASEAGETRAPQ